MKTQVTVPLSLSVLAFAAALIVSGCASHGKPTLLGNLLNRQETAATQQEAFNGGSGTKSTGGSDSKNIAPAGSENNQTKTAPAQGSATKTEGSASKPVGSGTKNNANLLDLAASQKTAPAQFHAEFVTTKGNFTVEVNREWAPNGADRFYSMVTAGYFQDIAVFRAIDGFMFQFGIHGDPKVSAVWSEATIPDDPAKGVSNLPGYLTFAQTGRPNSRSTQMFINLGHNSSLDRPRSGSPFVPFARVVKGMDVVKQINTQYGENRGDVQGQFKRLGNDYIKKEFPFVDFIKSVNLISGQ